MNEQEKIEVYLSSVRHDLRSQLMVVREGASMILDGIGNSNCETCFTLLRPALESTDELNKLIGDLLSAPRFNAMLGSLLSAKEEEWQDEKKEPLGSELEILKYELMGMISHVVRTPLAVVKESLSLVLDGIPGKVNPKQNELLSIAKLEVDGLIQSIEQIFQKSWDEVVHASRNDFPAEAIAGKGGKEGPARPAPKKRILIVEDQAVILNMLKMRLEANNYEVITAADGQEGLEKAHKENPNLIILDIMLPKLNGYKVCQLLKGNPKYSAIPIIISSGRTAQEIRKVGQEVGADAYVSKPFEAEELLSKMRELLEKKEKSGK
jgi:CheY-like chemotaxis protein